MQVKMDSSRIDSLRQKTKNELCRFENKDFFVPQTRPCLSEK